MFKISWIILMLAAIPSAMGAQPNQVIVQITNWLGRIPTIDELVLAINACSPLISIPIPELRKRPRLGEIALFFDSHPDYFDRIRENEAVLKSFREALEMPRGAQSSKPQMPRGAQSSMLQMPRGAQSSMLQIHPQAQPVGRCGTRQGKPWVQIGGGDSSLYLQSERRDHGFRLHLPAPSVGEEVRSSLPPAGGSSGTEGFEALDPLLQDPWFQFDYDPLAPIF
ncbi:MAG: hypothetical protein LBF65_00195 [Holosporales bacterium]|nr:hypothetical protein [Holosporales bacterium]